MFIIISHNLEVVNKKINNFVDLFILWVIITNMLDIKNCDCMELMKEYPDKYFELAIVDPPYGRKADEFNLRTSCHVKFKQKGWDKKPKKEYFREITRVSDNQIIFGGNYFTDILAPNNNWIVWYKNNDGVSFSMAELAWCSLELNIKVFHYRPMGKLNKIHPTQKPVALYEWLLTKYAKKGDKILDTHMGSGSIAIACNNLGFDLTACELDKDYYDAAMKRITFHQAQKRLFT